jgi:splicing factor U2AF subunit
MASYLASTLFGSESDKQNCPFYLKTGACRHGTSCTRVHHKPRSSPTLLIPHLYENPAPAIALAEGQDVSESEISSCQAHLEQFSEKMFIELSELGKIEELKISDNIGDHLLGHVYVRFAHESEAKRAMEKFPTAQLCPLLNLYDVRCRQFDQGACARGGFCNFMHWKFIPRAVVKRLRRKYEVGAGVMFDDKDL